MPLSYRNIIGNKSLTDTIGLTNNPKIGRVNSNNAKYVKGYESDTFWESVFGGNLNAKNDPEIRSRFGKLLDIQDKQLDPYDPFTTTGAKTEEYWDKPGRNIFMDLDEDVSTFRNIITNKNFKDSETPNEDPLRLGFRMLFNTDSPLFYDKPVDGEIKHNTMLYFMQAYRDIADINERLSLWREFKLRLFDIFTKKTSDGTTQNNTPYYINKITGLQSLNKKIIKYGEDKISITLNEDVRMISFYIAELYRTLAYDYTNKRTMFPENVLRFDLDIEISDVRNFINIQYKDNSRNSSDFTSFSGQTGDLSYQLSQKSTIMYTLHDCSFNFFESANFREEITMAGFGANLQDQSDLSFDIIFKSVTRWSRYPLLGENIDPDLGGLAKQIDPWKNADLDYQYGDIEIRNSRVNVEQKSYLNDRLTNLTQTVSNAGLNYLDNLETRLREERGKFVEQSLQQLRELTNINKIEPDNVYSPDFNNRLSLKNTGRALAADILNDFEGNIRDITNF